MREFAKSFYRSVAWKNARAAYLQKVGGLCEDCLEKGLITPAVIVHHKIELTPENITDADIALSEKNLKAVCRACHAAEHEETYMRRFNPGMHRYSVGKDGSVKVRPDRERISVPKIRTRKKFTA